MSINKVVKRHIIRFVFVIPFILCLFTSLGIKAFLDNQAYKRPEATEYNLVNIVNYRMSTLYMPADEEGQKEILISTTDNLDKLKGIGSALYKKTETDYIQLTQIYDNLEENQNDLVIPENYFQPDKIAFSAEGYILGNYFVYDSVKGENTAFKIYYATYNNYILIWMIRPDMINSYFVDYDLMFGLIVLVFLVNCVASFIALISYYCLENRVRYFIKRIRK